MVNQILDGPWHCMWGQSMHQLYTEAEEPSHSTLSSPSTLFSIIAASGNEALSLPSSLFYCSSTPLCAVCSPSYLPGSGREALSCLQLALFVSLFVSRKTLFRSLFLSLSASPLLFLLKHFLPFSPLPIELEQ